MSHEHCGGLKTALAMSCELRAKSRGCEVGPAPCPDGTGSEHDDVHRSLDQNLHPSGPKRLINTADAPHQLGPVRLGEESGLVGRAAFRAVRSERHRCRGEARPCC